MSYEDDENAPKRRRRVKTKTFEFDELDNEEQRMIQQALKNSQMQTTRVQVDVPQAPVYHPTVEEFKNPLKYISSIRAEAERYGICKIVPPAEWTPPCMIDFNDPRRFPTKLQLVNILQEGQGFDSGKTFSIREYKEMSDTFYETWAQTHYPEGGMAAPTLNMTGLDSSLNASESGDGDGEKKVSVKEDDDSAGLFDSAKGHGELNEATKQRYKKLAKDYWDMVDMGGGSVSKQATVEYANDLDTTKYISGFPLRGGVDKSKSSKSYNSRDEKPPTAEQVVAANAAAVAAAAAKQKEMQESDGKVVYEHKPMGVEPADCADMFSADYYTRTGWNLVNIAASEGSVLTHLQTSINGINVPWLYIGMLFSSFCWHNEDNYLYSINYSHFGESKQWYGVPGADAKKFESVTKNFLMESFKDAPDLLHHMTTQISPALLMSNRVPVYQLIQTERTFVVTFPKSFHAGFSYGFNCGEAVNFATPDWLKEGTEADERYRAFRRSSVFSHQRLLLTLLYHNVQDSSKQRTGQFTDKAAYMSLLKEIKKVLDEELLSRPWLISQGVRDISHLIKLPSNNFLCIDESSSNYDDLRSCCACKHICLLTAIACECDRNKVACVRHFTSTCKCSKEKRYMLQWMSTADMSSMSRKVDRLLKELSSSS